MLNIPNPVITTTAAPVALTFTERELTRVLVQVNGYGDPIPLVTLACSACSRVVDVCAAQDTWFVSRVNGDSRYGYEPSHQACYPPEPEAGVWDYHVLVMRRITEQVCSE